MNYIKSVGIGLVMVTLVGYASITGNDWLRLSEMQRGMFATGYLRGLKVGVWMKDGPKDLPAKATRMVACIASNGVTGEQLADVVTKNIREHPETRHHSLEDHVIAAVVAICP